MRKRWLIAIAVVAVLAVLAVLTIPRLPGIADSRALGAPPPAVASVFTPVDDAVLAAADVSALSLQLTAERFASADTVVVADAARAATAGEEAARRNLPLVVAPPAPIPAGFWDQVRAEVTRLGATS